MSANIDLSASKGNISHINTGCLWNTNYPPRIAESCCRLSATCVELSGGKMKGRDIRERERERWARERERSAGIGGRQTSKMKKGEGRGMKRMTMSEKK